MATNKEPANLTKLQQMKLRICSLLSYLKYLHHKSEKVTKPLATAACAIFALCAAYVFVARAPELHDLYLRNAVGSKVFMIRATPTSGGGTGFQVKAPSGQNYIVTNSHVCNYILKSRPDNTVLVGDDSDNYITRRIIEVSGYSDLCLIEGMPGVDGLSLGKEPGIGQHVWAVGHPELKPLSLSTGSITGAHDVQIIKFILPTGDAMLDFFLPAIDPNGKCDLPKEQMVDIKADTITVHVCYDVTAGAYMSTVVIYPGNSGSPVVDWYGHIVGVAFAANGMDNWSDIVSINDLKDLLAHY